MALSDFTIIPAAELLPRIQEMAHSPFFGVLAEELEKLPPGSLMIKWCVAEKVLAILDIKTLLCPDMIDEIFEALRLYAKGENPNV